MRRILINAEVVNEGKTFRGNVIIRDQLIEAIIPGNSEGLNTSGAEVIDVNGKFLLPGIIDDQVHFREPGLTHKADIYTESKAAVAGGVTSFMEMPNTIPPSTTIDLLEEKYKIAAEKSLANYSFYIGASNGNIEELKKINNRNVCGIKVFMGSSTGNMLVDNEKTLQEIFSLNSLIAAHCEDEEIIKANLEKYKAMYGEDIPVRFHPEIRSAEACYRSSSKAFQLAVRYNSRLHLLHLSSAAEMGLLENFLPLEKKKITSEVCVHHLWFSSDDYDKKGTFIKWNPSIKSTSDRKALWDALLDNRIDVIATDHAPHTYQEKNNTYLKSPSGGPLLQHSLPAMFEFYSQGKISVETIVHKMSHAPAICFNIEKRGFLRPGYYADIVIVDPDLPATVDKSNIVSKCGWSPFEGTTFSASVTKTFVNGELVYENGKFYETVKGMRLLFNRE